MKIYCTMKKNILLCLFLLFFTTISAQNQGKIFGKITDSAAAPLEYVNVAVYAKNASAPVNGVLSNSKGEFVFTNMAYGAYTLKVSFVGYKTIERTAFITKEKTANNLGNIILREDSKIMDEVQVVGQKSGVSFEIDKKVFTVDQSIMAQGASATDVLQNIPSVTVDTEGNISLRNNSSVEIWINGKPSNLTDEDKGQVLEQLPAETIDKIEVMTNPSAKHSAEGSAGIINIVLKENRRKGYLASVNSSLSYTEEGKLSGSLGGNLMSSGRKFDINANASLRSGNSVGGGYNNRATIDGTDTISHLNQTNESGNNKLSGFLKGEIIYHINKKNDIGIDAFGMLGKNNSYNDIDYSYLDSNRDTTKTRDRDTKSSNNRIYYNTSIDYKHFFEKDKNELSSSISYVKRSNESNNYYNTSDYAANNSFIDGSKTYQKQSSDKNTEHFSWNTDYLNKFTSNIKLESGLSFNYDNSLNKDRTYDSTFTSEALIEDTTQYNEFTYIQQVYAAYATYGQKIKNFSFQLGLRGEETFTNAENHTKSYFYLFPTLFLSQTLPADNQVQLSYTRRINRPRGMQLDNFKNKTDASNISYGNPDLMPELANALEFNYLKNWEQGHTISASVYYRYTSNVIQSVRKMENEVMETTYENITSSQAAGVELIAKDKLFSNKLDLTTTLNGYYSKLAGNEEYDIASTEKISWNARINANIILGKNLSGQITGNYNSPQLISQGTQNESYRVDLGVKKSFFDQTFNVSLSVKDLLDSQRTKSITWGKNFYQESENTFSGRSYRLSLTYNFGNMKMKKNQKNQKSSDEGIEENGDL